MTGKDFVGITGSVLVKSLILVLVVSLLTAAAGGEKEVKLTFDMPEGRFLHYKSSSSVEQEFFGTSMTMNQSAETEMAMVKKTQEGNYKLSIKFNNIRSGMVRGDDLMDWEPPIKLEGKTVNVVVSPEGEIVGVEAGAYIPGLKKKDDLKDIVKGWFVKLPDSTVGVGYKWREEIVKKDEKAEDKPPEIEGWADYTFKKISKKAGIEVAEIEVELKFTVNRDVPGGTFSGEGRGKRKACVALDGGYIVESSNSIDIEGKTLLASSDQEINTLISQSFETKLKK